MKYNLYIFLSVFVFSSPSLNADNARVSHDKNLYSNSGKKLDSAKLTPRSSPFGYLAFPDDNDVYKNKLGDKSIIKESRDYFSGKGIKENSKAMKNLFNLKDNKAAMSVEIHEQFQDYMDENIYTKGDNIPDSILGKEYNVLESRFEEFSKNNKAIYGSITNEFNITGDNENYKTFRSHALKNNAEDRNGNMVIALLGGFRGMTEGSDILNEIKNSGDIFKKNIAYQGFYSFYPITP